MPLVIPNTPTQDAYQPVTTFAGSDVFVGGYFTVANNPVAVQLGVGPQGQASWSFEQYLPPATYPVIPGGKLPISGLRFRSFVAGNPAQIFGSLIYPGEPSIQAGTPYSSFVDPSGGVSLAVGEITYAEASVNAVSGGPRATFLDTGFFNIGALTTVLIQWFIPYLSGTATSNAILSMLEDAIDIGDVWRNDVNAGASQYMGVYGQIRRQLASGTHRYQLQGRVSAGALTANMGVGGVGVFRPGYIRVESSS